ncbi:choice-of-anchor Q domain-containing protein [Ideonella sp.]|uniref:choice-of-anchor Q domain-containing protein n=1 Tax=Ideonella sp. TaxID=1929293 RepID=UPI0035B49BCA
MRLFATSLCTFRPWPVALAAGLLCAHAAPAAQPPGPAAVPAAAAVQSTPEEQVTQLYLTMLNRIPDPAGLAYWSQVIRDGGTSDTVAAGIEDSPEYIHLTRGLPPTTHNYWVSPYGSDTSAGTKDKPFKTLARAVQAAQQPSTTVWVAPGVYTGGLKTTAHGTATGRIIWAATSKWAASLVQPTHSSTSTAWDNRGDYVSIVGFDVDGSKLPQTGPVWRIGLYTGGSHSVIERNRVHHIANTSAYQCTSGGGSGINVDSYYKGVNGEVRSNVVHDIGKSDCTYVQGIYFSTTGAVRNNVVHRIGEAAIHLWHDAHDIEIVNNTLTSSKYGIIVGGGNYYYWSKDLGGANFVDVHNNLIYDNTYGVSEQGDTGTSNTYYNNLVMQNPGYSWSLRAGMRHYNTVACVPPAPCDPKFVAYSRSAPLPDVHLRPDSPAIGRGIGTYAPPVDADGKPRNASTGYDIGAYQH